MLTLFFLVESTWLQFCSKFDGETLSLAVGKFHLTLFRDVVHCVSMFPVYVLLKPEMASMCELPLLEVHMAKLCYCLSPEGLANFLDHAVCITLILSFLGISLTISTADFILPQ
jgi:hypothetical protein